MADARAACAAPEAGDSGHSRHAGHGAPHAASTHHGPQTDHARAGRCTGTSEHARTESGARASDHAGCGSSAGNASSHSARRAAERCVSELSPYQLRFLDTVTGSPMNGVTRLRATALRMHERSPAGGEAAPKCTELGTPEGAKVATICA